MVQSKVDRKSLNSSADTLRQTKRSGRRSSRNANSILDDESMDLDHFGGQNTNNLKRVAFTRCVQWKLIIKVWF